MEPKTGRTNGRCGAPVFLDGFGVENCVLFVFFGGRERSAGFSSRIQCLEGGSCVLFSGRGEVQQPFALPHNRREPPEPWKLLMSSKKRVVGGFREQVASAHLVFYRLFAALRSLQRI